MPPASLPEAPLRLAYVCWVYPEISQSFVQREVAALRAEGVEVLTTAVRRAAPEQLLGERERTLDAETWAVLPVAPLALLLGHLRVLLRAPRPYLATLRAAVRGRVAVRSPRDLLTPLFYFAEAVLLAQRLRQDRLTHLHAHFGDVGAEVARLVAHLERGRGTDFTWSFTLHGPGELLDPTRFRLAEKVAQADLTVAITQYCRSQLIALVGEEHWDRIRVVHCGLDVDAWPRRPHGARAGGPLRLLTVGRLHPQKSHHVLLQALALLRDAGVEIDLTLVGEGPSRAFLEGEVARLRLQDRVHLVGALGSEQVRELFAEADAFALASVSEGLPVVLMEAMAAGLPVVTTDITGVRELVREEVDGLLVPAADPQALAAALRRVVEEEGLAERLAAAAPASVRAGFDSADNARLLAAHLREVRAGSTRAPVLPIG